jgi:hypothetical protein
MYILYNHYVKQLIYPGHHTGKKDLEKAMLRRDRIPKYLCTLSNPNTRQVCLLVYIHEKLGEKNNSKKSYKRLI